MECLSQCNSDSTNICLVCWHINNQHMMDEKHIYLWNLFKPNTDGLENMSKFNRVKYDINTGWWNDVCLKPSEIPECSACKNDFTSYKSLKAENKLKDYKDSCSKFCLWYDWFQAKKQLLN